MTTIFPLNLVLSRFSALNVTGRVPRKPRDFVGSGGFGDIYKGELDNTAAANGSESRGEENLVVAIKSVRASLMNDDTFEKVCR